MKPIIGRERELSQLRKLNESSRSEFVAVYGRRRIGKTFLIKQFFGGQYDFQVTGIFNAGLRQQILNFYAALNRHAKGGISEPVPETWFAAFQLLIQHLERLPEGRKVVFIDELPWMDTPKSGFVSALEHFWNSWAYHRDDILLIVCGSATTWMIDALINNYGGLHNRVTARIPLHPFNLYETDAFLKSKGGAFEPYQILELYMALGGVPFYLEEVDISKSIPQNIDALFFSESGILRSEFDNLYRSLFKKHERHEAIIEALSQKGIGLNREDIAKLTGISNGGTLTTLLKELEQCEFIRKYQPFGSQKRGALFQLTDPYSLFYLKFIKNTKAIGPGVWLSLVDQPSWRSWSGYAFENVCLLHLNQIKQHLGISGVYTEAGAWRSKKSDPAVQIDLLLDRRDRVINICEMKFAIAPYSITKSEAEKFRYKLLTLKSESQTAKGLFMTFISPFGLMQNQYSGVVHQVITHEALFRPTFSP